MSDEKQEIVIPEENRCEYCGCDDVDHTHTNSHMCCGSCCAQHGMLAGHEYGHEEYAFVEKIIANKNRILAKLTAADARARSAEAERDAAIELAAWKPITPESLPKVGDENGGAFGLFRPTWEVRPYERFPLSDAVCFEALKLAGWTHYRSINAPSIVADGEPTT